MVANLPICISTGEGVGGDHQVCLCVMQAIPHGCNTHCNVSCLIRESAIPPYFCHQCDVVLLLYSPIYCRRVQLSSVEEEVLSAIIGSVGGLFRPGMERAGVNRAVPAICHEELGIVGHKVNVDKGGDVQLAGWVRNELEEPVPRVFKVAEPFRSWQYSWLRSGIFYSFSHNLCFDGSEHVLQCRSWWMRRDGCHVEVVRQCGWIGWWGDIVRNRGCGCDWLAVREDGRCHWGNHEWGRRCYGSRCSCGVEYARHDRGVAPEILKYLGDGGIEHGCKMAYHCRMSLGEPEAIV